MPSNRATKAWEEYRDRELAGITPILTRAGFSLGERQPHISGERYLMQAVTTAHGKKLILLGKRTSDGKKVVIKATSDPRGMEEIEHERLCRKVLQEINFAYQVFFSPQELLFTQESAYMISVQEFLEQKSPFLERPIEQQFALALRAFKAQEGAHATTYRHLRLVKKTFGEQNGVGYLSAFKKFEENIGAHLPEEKELCGLLGRGEEFLRVYRDIIEQYSGFLTHVDFVPHNFRIADERMYLLDHSSLRFGNKYEGWARFLNFMTLYHPTLEEALVRYVRDNRTPEESLSLKLMRIYRLGEIIWYYVRALKNTSGDLHALEVKRIWFWSEVLKAVLEDRPLREDIRKEYAEARDALRSPEEKNRQIGLH